jgi:hypothetical protein
MAFEHTYPGQPLRIKSQDWNGAMDAARAVASGETGLRANVLNGFSSGGTIQAKNTSGADLERFDIVDLDGMIFSPSDNLSGYKNGPTPTISGPPASGRLAHVAVCMAPIPAGKTGEVAIAGWSVCRVHEGAGSYAWPAAGDSEAFERSPDSGFPILDTGSFVDGLAWAVILLRPTNDSGGIVNNFPGLTNSECQCGKSVRGKEVTDCEDCACVNMLRRTSLPEVNTIDGDAWPEVQEIVELTYEGNCEHKSQKIPGPSCWVGDPEEEVNDEYQFVVNYATGIAELKCVTDSPQCDVLYVKWEFCPSCAKECTSVWRMRRVQYSNVTMPNGDCEICITPLKDRTQTALTCSTCAAETGFVLPGEVQIRIFDHPVPSTKLCGGAGVTIPAAYTECTFNGIHLCSSPPNKEALWIAADYPTEEWQETIGEDIEDFLSGSDPVMCDVVWAKQFIRNVCSADPPCPAEGFLPNQVVHWVWVWIEGTAGAFSIKAYLKAGESSSISCGFFRESHYESAGTYTCEELAALRDFDSATEDAPEIELEFVSGSDNNGSVGPYESIWFSFQVPPDDPAPSSGETGADCGPPEEEPCSKPCRLVVAMQNIDSVPTKVWRIKRSKGCGTALCSCSGMDQAFCGEGITDLSDYPACGLASDHDVGFECNVPCATGTSPTGQCDGVPALLSATIGGSSFDLTDGVGLGGGTCDGDSYTIDITYSCPGTCPRVTYSINGGECTGTAVRGTIVSLDPVDVEFGIPGGACCSTGLTVHITE